ncbi:MAG: M23 family metallopeptidase [Bifidobacterium crudilactis]|jgi:murein DD-endopeptidase MepM/ murein hydrolase activator NlpD|nr:M23 family metallopeptidase [Bifidobacterium crudilactis]
MAALTESTLRMLANTSAYPQSADYPNDGDASDHDSLGLFQMRPQSGWGSVKHLMDPAYQVKRFFGGPTGPNYPSPRGLLDTLTTPTASNSGEPNAAIAETSRIVFPLPEGTWVMTSPFGYRIHPIIGARTLHEGTDYAAPDGTSIYAVADGVVTLAEYSEAWGGHIVIDHTVDGKPVSTGYIHMWAFGIHVTIGQRVTAGQHIGDVGSSGQSTGPHLHFEVRPDGGQAIDSDKWLKDHGATSQNNGGDVDTSGACVSDSQAEQATPAAAPATVDVSREAN